MTELGSRLKEAREAKGLSLDDLQNITKIQKRYLLGIEEGNYSMIPGKFYVRAFIKQYAEAVGLQPDNLFDEYRQEIPTVYEDNLPEQISRAQSRKSVPRSSSKVMEYLPKIVFTLFIVGIVILLWYFFVNAMGKDNATTTVNEPTTNDSVDYDQSGNTPTEEEQEAADKETDEATEENTDSTQDEAEASEESEQQQQITQVSAEGSTTSYTVSNTTQFQLELKVTQGGKSWISVTSDTGQKFSGTITDANPQTLDLSNETEVSIKIGAIPQTELYINGEKVDIPATPTVQTIVIQYNKSAE